jgi:hypothetical protein
MSGISGKNAAIFVALTVFACAKSVSDPITEPTPTDPSGTGASSTSSSGGSSTSSASSSGASASGGSSSGASSSSASSSSSSSSSSGGASLDPDLSLPGAGGTPCTTPGSEGECPGIQVCRIASATGGRCEGCSPCNNLNQPCASSNECDILFQCFRGKCTNICPLGTSYCGAVADCVNVGNATYGVCK